MKLSDLCPGKAENIFIPTNAIFWPYNDDRHAIRGVKRIRMKCELCGRKIPSSIITTGDGDLIHIIPPHKPKHWWKRKNKK